MDLLAAVRIQRDAYALQGFVAAFWTELLVEERRRLEAGIATQNPRLSFLQN